MKKYYNTFIMLVIALMGLSLTGCSNDDLNTDQFGNDITLQSFGPCPVLRGGTLHFMGSNLDQISEIDLPGADPITQYEVLKSGRESEITIQVPAEKCTTGTVTLKTAKGGVITSVTPITYREDIKLTQFYVGTEKNYTGSVGQTITIKGDYLNLIHGIIFADKDTVNEKQFTAHDRYTITVAIPKEAKTGTFKLTDLAATPNEIETSEALVINLPTVSSLTPETIKAGSNITITGESLDQIASVKFTGATTDKFTIAQDGKSISVTVPAKATDGEINLVTCSGVEIPAGSIKTVVPTELVAAPNPIKNGADITITGKDLDLVTGIAFPNAAGSIKSANATTIVATVPEKAQNGDITLSLANGKTVTVAYKLVAPVVTEFSQTSIIAGNPLVIKGTNLDLVASVVFPGEGSPTDTTLTKTDTTIGLTIPEAAEGTGLKFILKNGETVNVTGITINASSTPAVSIDASGIIGGYVTISGKNFNNVETVSINDTKVVKYSARTNTSMTFQIPSTIKAGTYDLKMVTPDGTSTVVCKITAVSPELDVANYVKSMDGKAIAYPYTLTWGDDGRFKITQDIITSLGIKIGSTIRIYKKTTTKGQVQIDNGDWKIVTTLTDWNATESTLSYTFSKADMDLINQYPTIIIQGGLNDITKITIQP
ncbi:MAG: IPT/TIG domain-containing protein [Prevotella sp.]|uniref:IPT/TIG domain-containing protein n=1 Tax=Prevotella sp. TaxID=59823 RepID=UPI001B5FC764|nr:IPT/TIG domain-containing protein [Prevotella sp.]MBP8935226.1 IPT/TIG domain-containing protein [Prevotella sp.]MDN5553666.1 IPT/TIG domain-containing protein [Prevotella sp.]